MDLFDIAVASKLAGGGGGGGGASNVVFGEFTTEGNSIQTVEVPYTGSGFPVAAMIWVKGGYSAALNAIEIDNVFAWGMVKFNTDTPSWTSTNNSRGTLHAIYKQSASAVQAKVGIKSDVLITTDPTTSDYTNIVHFPSSSKFKLCQNTGSGKYFFQGLTYQYVIVYSS